MLKRQLQKHEYNETTVRNGIINFYYVKTDVLVGRLLWTKEIMNYIFMTNLECYNISIIFNEIYR